MQVPEFENTPLLDFSRAENRVLMEDALADVRGQLGRVYPLVIGGQPVFSATTFDSMNPSRSSEVIGTFQRAGPEFAEPALEAAEKAFETWGRTSAEERVARVLDLAARLRARRCELAAWMVLEVGKSWIEADADVAEAIDFCEFYARQMLRLAQPQPLVDYPGEENELIYLPMGVGLILPPWNFPLAILTGMSIAAVVSGNTIILKPSSDSPAIASRFVQICEEAGLPPGVVNLVTGSGSEIGEPLVAHSRVRFISFTGSMQVGLRINEMAARPASGQIWIKRVVAEMGGKDAIIVDNEADLAAAASGVTASAFGFQGQKCSACSRAIVVEDVYDEFLERLLLSTREMVQPGSVEKPECNFGPVINESAQKKILEYIEEGKREGVLVWGGGRLAGDGYYVEPTIFKDVDPEGKIGQEEIFGPVLAVMRARDYEHAVQIANDTVFGLTGSVYSRNQEKLRLARREFQVGNLYLNRKCTGALVGVHPFGGFRLSGTNSKAGGRDYLLLYTEAKSIARSLS